MESCSVAQAGVLTSPFMWRWTGMAGALSALDNTIEDDADDQLPCGEGRPGWVRGELLGSQGVCKDSKDLFVPTSSSLYGCFCVGLVSGMAISVLLLASDFRKLDFSRPEPCFEKEASLWFVAQH
uniref:Colorectal cancer-associated protein 1 n=2 Tax=Homo sapiens TaxID=9606 RepID=COLC1_HUMAN|nr:RecName: Full=Colorectal cancer-associated protein 1 [Homo sapiens]AHF20916.1 colorectal cancer associated 1 [Homo sapiens]AHF20917.1 colorectal cancer associated 1 [Homo sapiens]AHF20918.1 colorectal cancer associated 1 [Homo sapiens]AHF20919.1 colorectal cancer associated 1 [Homo sapiens]AHF20920.1 colorectal cancer associated 1 [Homo sapiens]|eukprot:NP_001289573.1 colorectal cancer-associated protein 1 [Homo sapiens]